MIGFVRYDNYPEFVARALRDWIVSALSDAMTTFMDAPERAQAMGQAGRRRVRDDFGWPKKAADLLEVFSLHLSTPSGIRRREGLQEIHGSQSGAAACW